MKNYDFKLAKNIIEKFHGLGVLEEASLGMHEDWFWTAQTIWKDGAYIQELVDNQEELMKEYDEKRQAGMSIISDECAEYHKTILIGGISGSSWATPVIQLQLKDGSTVDFNCYSGEWTVTMEERFKKMVDWVGGVISQPLQQHRDTVEIQEFKEN